MPSLIEELQRDALDTDVSAADLLRKCVIVGTKLSVNELTEWAMLELEGYNDVSTVPPYREVRGTPQVWNPYHGYQSVTVQDPKLAQMLSTMRFNSPVSEIEYTLQESNQRKQGGVHITYPTTVANLIMSSLEVPLSPSMFISGGQLHKIIDAVRRIVLDWSLKLEAAGVIGSGLSFSAEERRKAQTVSYHIGNIFHGSVDNSQVQAGTTSSTQNQVFKQSDAAELREIVSRLRGDSEAFGLGNDHRLELEAEIQTLEAQANSPKPKSSIIRETLGSIRRILEGAAGNAVAAAALYYLSKYS